MNGNEEWPGTPSEAANSLKHIAADHPCCAVTLNAIIAWLGNVEKQSDALDQIARLYEDRPTINLIDAAGLLYDARCIARTALSQHPA